MTIQKIMTESIFYILSFDFIIQVWSKMLLRRSQDLEMCIVKIRNQTYFTTTQL